MNGWEFEFKLKSGGDFFWDVREPIEIKIKHHNKNYP
jgi:hypothetical protein